MDNATDFIIGQVANAQSSQAAQLAAAINDAIEGYREHSTNGGSFCVNATYEDGEFAAQCSFEPDYAMVVLYDQGTADDVVASLFGMRNEGELCRLAGLMLSEGWVDGYEGGAAQ